MSKNQTKKTTAPEMTDTPVAAEDAKQTNMEQQSTQADGQVAPVAPVAPTEQKPETTPEPKEVEPTPAPAPEPTETPVEETKETATDVALKSESKTISMLARTFQTYMQTMGKSKATDRTVIIEQNLQLWAVLRMIANNDQEVFRDSMNYIMSVFRENEDDAFTLPMLLRNVDTPQSRLNTAHRDGYKGIMALISTAAGINNPKDVGKMINIAKALESEVFTVEARQRLTGYFAA